MLYIERALEQKFLHMSSFFKAVLVTGARQRRYCLHVRRSNINRSEKLFYSL